MHSLIITAHPSTHGFTHAIAQRYREAKEKNGHTVEILDLYKTELKMGYLDYENKSDMKKPDPIRDSIQAKITAADELVFIFPIWHVNIPAILKNFFDTIFTGGFAYQYTPNTFLFPKKLLTGKTARIFCTCDAFGFLYWFIGNPLRMILQIGVLGWCGIKIKSYTNFDRMRKRTHQQCQKMLEKVERIAG
ncbi:NAD(P)H-dependent oxidoreductase [Candidatus Gracilibacteria bacterium]|nr:NAD(P)H-dependent oxidoreductase [Candidatus Gracilibacteria bacterium]